MESRRLPAERNLGRGNSGRGSGVPQPPPPPHGPGRGGRHFPPPLSPALSRCRRLPSRVQSGALAPGKSLYLYRAFLALGAGRREERDGDGEGRRNRGRWRPRSRLSPGCFPLSAAPEAALHQGGTFKFRA